MPNFYDSPAWATFRETVVQFDDYRCRRCGRERPEVVLQVHHLRYIPNRKPWEYPPTDCETLCKGCHAREHCRIQPVTGWEYLGSEDLGDLVGDCENEACTAKIRYVFHVWHPGWGELAVGEICCDNLTDTDIASSQMESVRRFASRCNRFVSSPRWETDGTAQVIKQRIGSGRVPVEVRPGEQGVHLWIAGYPSKYVFKAPELAKAHAFTVIEDGTVEQFLARRCAAAARRDQLRPRNAGTRA